MTGASAEELVDEARRWWQTDIIDVRPGEIALRGYPIQELIGNVGFVDTIWLMLRGELPSRAQAALLEAALVASVDHGPQAPSIAIARMATTCGAAGQRRDGVGDQRARRRPWRSGPAVHGVLPRDRRRARAGRVTSKKRPVLVARNAIATRVSRYIPGFGHRFHPLDPRTPRLLSLVDAAAAEGVGGRPLRGDRPRGRGRDQRGKAQAHPHERRRSDGRHLLRTRPDPRSSGAVSSSSRARSASSPTPSSR